MNVHGKTALITGASRGIGRAIALELAQQGAKCLILVARDRDRLNTVASEVEALGIEAVSLPLDLSQTIEVNIAIAQVWRDFGPIDILVNCAGVLGSDAALFDQTAEDWDRVFDVNLKGSWMAATHISQYMVAQHIKGRIINISSSLGLRAQLKRVPYASSKAAVEHLTRNMAMELV